MLFSILILDVMHNMQLTLPLRRSKRYAKIQTNKPDIHGNNNLMVATCGKTRRGRSKRNMERREIHTYGLGKQHTPFHLLSREFH